MYPEKPLSVTAFFQINVYERHRYLLERQAQLLHQQMEFEQAYQALRKRQIFLLPLLKAENEQHTSNEA